MCVCVCVHQCVCNDLATVTFKMVLQWICGRGNVGKLNKELGRYRVPWHIAQTRQGLSRERTGTEMKCGFNFYIYIHVCV